MIKKVFLSLVVMIAVSQASVQELLPGLASSDLMVRTKAKHQLFEACSVASRPGAEAERTVLALEINTELKRDLPPRVASPLIRSLKCIGQAESVPLLVELLSDTHEHIRDDARRALVFNPSAEAGQALLAQVKMRKARSARETAGFINGLGERREAGSSVLIATYLGSQDRYVFEAAAKALSRLNELEGIRALAMRRKKEKGPRKVVLDSALFEIDRLEILKKLYSEKESIDVRAVALLGLVMNNDIETATTAMASGEPAFQSAVIEAASQSNNPAVYNLVAKTIEKLPAHLQVQAMGALEFSENSSYAKFVEPFLDSNDTDRQIAAAQALARIGTDKSILPLLSAGTPDALRALGALNADGVDAVLEKMVVNDDAYRAAAINSLAARGRTDLIPTFFKYAAGNDEAAAKAAVKALGSIGSISDLEPLVSLMIAKETSPLSRDILNATVAVMRRSSDEAKAVNILVAEMKGASPRSQANILQALVQTGSNETLKSVAEACKSSDEKLQKLAVKLLSGWKNDNAIPTMIELASDTSMSTANHVNLMRGVSRLLAGQRKLDEVQAGQALEACRRSEEKQMIQDVIDNKKT